MKQATLQIKFDEEKLKAIKQYMGKKDAALDKELEDVMQKQFIISSDHVRKHGRRVT